MGGRERKKREEVDSHLVNIFLTHYSFSSLYSSGLVTHSSADKPKPQQLKTQQEQLEERLAKESRSQKHNRVSVRVCERVHVSHFKGMAGFSYFNVITKHKVIM